MNELKFKNGQVDKIEWVDFSKDGNAFTGLLGAMINCDGLGTVKTLYDGINEGVETVKKVYELDKKRQLLVFHDGNGTVSACSNSTALNEYFTKELNQKTNFLNRVYRITKLGTKKTKLGNTFNDFRIEFADVE